MRWWLAMFVVCAPPASAQDVQHQKVPADKAITNRVCEDLVADAVPELEKLFRLRFRRRLMTTVESMEAWEARVRNDPAARNNVVYLDRERGVLTVVPWSLGVAFSTPVLLSRKEWRGMIEGPVLNLMAHALLEQNMPRPGSRGDVERRIVRELVLRGACELASLRAAKHGGPPRLSPRAELLKPVEYIARYRGGQAMRHILSGDASQDGLDLIHYLTFHAGMRGVRAALYRPPPLELLARPAVLGAMQLDDPPEPDAVLRFLAPGTFAAGGVRLSLRPNEVFDARAPDVKGCLLGYVAESKDALYAFYVADPDAPGTWAKAQADALRALNPAGARESRALLPLSRDVPVDLIVSGGPKGVWVRAELDGLVVLAREAEVTPALVRRVLLALRHLDGKRPRPRPWDDALEALRRRGPGAEGRPR